MAPSWLELLLATQFFSTCTNHLGSSRNECNLFCVDCEEQPIAFCQYCRSSHHSAHRVIQIRKSSYHNVVRVSELEDILDISTVQTYVINGAKVVFLNERPQSRGGGVSAGKEISSPSHKCEMCCRALLDEFRFCSIGCKLTCIKKDMEILSRSDNGPEGSKKEDVADGGDTGSGIASSRENPSENDEEQPPPKRVARHRRKGIPRRAPFF